jgi:hypothetical protein
MFGQQSAAPAGANPRRSAFYAGAVTFTVILSTAAVLFGFRLSTRPHTPGRSLDAVALAGGGARTESVAATRLVVAGPQRLLDPGRTGALAPGAEAELVLPKLAANTRAVLLELSMLDATGPGAVTIRSDVDDVPALRVPAARAMTSAGVVVMLGPDRGPLRLRTEGGGRLLVNLVGRFETADSARAGRLIPVPPTRVLRLKPATDGHDAELDLDRLPGLRNAGSVSALLLNVAADVGPNGGHVYLGPAKNRLNQKVFWTATAGKDRTRYGLIVVPIRNGSFHLQYHAGKELRADVVGYVTGEQAADSAAGLVVPLPYRATGSVRVATAGRTNVPVVPASGLAGVTPDRVTAALLGITASSDTPGDLGVGTPGGTVAPPLLSAVPGKPRSALTLTRLAKGVAQVTGESGASVVLTPRALVLGR